MCGYTEEELGANFEAHLRAHAEKMGRSYEDYRAELKRWYNGYRFARKDPVTVYNPVSIALTLVSKDDMFRGHWSQTGRASSLMNVIRREGLLKLDYENLECVNEPASAALEQVRAKGYDAPYRGKGLPIHLVGLSFDSKTRHLADAVACSEA